MLIRGVLKIWENHVSLESQGPKAKSTNPTGVYLFKANNGNARAMCEICSKLKIKTIERGHWRYFDILNDNLEQISHIFLVFPLLALSKCWVRITTIQPKQFQQWARKIISKNWNKVLCGKNIYVKKYIFQKKIGKLFQIREFQANMIVFMEHEFI